MRRKHLKSNRGIFIRSLCSSISIRLKQTRVNLLNYLPSQNSSAKSPNPLAQSVQLRSKFTLPLLRCWNTCNNINRKSYNVSPNPLLFRSPLAQANLPTTRLKQGAYPGPLSNTSNLIVNNRQGRYSLLTSCQNRKKHRFTKLEFSRLQYRILCVLYILLSCNNFHHRRRRHRYHDGNHSRVMTVVIKILAAKNSIHYKTTQRSIEHASHNLALRCGI